MNVNVSPRQPSPLAAVRDVKTRGQTTSLNPPMSTPLETPPAHAQLIQKSTAYWVSRLVHLAAELGLADHLAAGPLSADAARQRPTLTTLCARSEASTAPDHIWHFSPGAVCFFLPS